MREKVEEIEPMSTITKEFTKEQLIEQAKKNIEVLRGAVEKIPGSSDAAVIHLKLAEITLASLEAEPVAYMYKDRLHTDARFSLHTRFGNWSQEDINEYEITEIPLYTVPPAPVSEREPEQMFGIGSVFKPQILSVDEVDCDNCAHYQPNVCHGEGCPSAMLQGEAEVVRKELVGWQFKSVNGDWLGLIDEYGKNQAVRDGCDVREVFAMTDSVNKRDAVREAHAEWSDATFGNVGPIGPLKHLSKEALEAAAEPDDLSEWADMQFLFWDAQRRAGISDSEITAAMEEKLKVNMARQWPEPKDGEPRLHIKAAPQQESE